MLYDEIDTPAVLVDLDVVDRNLQRFQAYCDERGRKSRPHIKTHKNIGFAKRQLELGAVGITYRAGTYIDNDRSLISRGVVVVRY